MPRLWLRQQRSEILCLGRPLCRLQLLRLEIRPAFLMLWINKKHGSECWVRSFYLGFDAVDIRISILKVWTWSSISSVDAPSCSSNRVRADGRSLRIYSGARTLIRKNAAKLMTPENICQPSGHASLTCGGASASIICSTPCRSGLPKICNIRLCPEIE